MSLLPIDEGLIDALLGFYREHGDPGLRDYLSRLDAGPMLLAQTDSFFWMQGDAPSAALSIRVMPHPAGHDNVNVSILTRGTDEASFAACLRAFLDAEERAGNTVPRRYRMLETPESPLPADVLRAAGFSPMPGRCEYRRQGPPRPGEFPQADQALAQGYRVLTLDRAGADAFPALYSQVAAIHNAAFSDRTGEPRRDEADIRELLKPEGSRIIVTALGETIAGYLAYLPLPDYVLATDVAAARKHWGSGCVDLLCRQIVLDCAGPPDLPIITYANARNAASRRMMERAGMTLAVEFPMWEYRPATA